MKAKELQGKRLRIIKAILEPNGIKIIPETPIISVSGILSVIQIPCNYNLIAKYLIAF